MMMMFLMNMQDTLRRRQQQQQQQQRGANGDGRPERSHFVSSWKPRRSNVVVFQRRTGFVTIVIMMTSLLLLVPTTIHGFQAASTTSVCWTKASFPQQQQRQQQRLASTTSRSNGSLGNSHLGARFRSSIDLLAPLSPNKVKVEADPDPNNKDDPNAGAKKVPKKQPFLDRNNTNNNNSKDDDDDDDDHVPITNFITEQLQSILASYREGADDEDVEKDSTSSSTTTPTLPASPALVRSDAAPAVVTTNWSHAVTAPTNNHIHDDDKWIMLGLLWSICCLSALDRVAMSLALIPLSIEYDLTDAVKGSISSLFSVGYGLAILPAGLLVGGRGGGSVAAAAAAADDDDDGTSKATVLSPKTVMAAGLALWSLATLATPFSVGTHHPDTINDNDATFFLALFLARAAVGAGESVILPSLQRFLLSWTTALEKSTALAVLFSGFHAGTIAAYLVSPWLMERHLHGGGDAVVGWRGLFVTYGLVGLGLLVPWMLWAKDEPNNSQGTTSVAVKGSNSVTALLVASSTSEHSSSNQLVLAINEAYGTLQEVPWQQFAQSKGTWAVVLAHCAKNWGLYNALAWTPTFFAESYDIGVRDSALLSVLPSVTGAVGGIVAGTAADSFLRNQLKEMEQNRNHSDETMTLMRTRVRKVFQSIAFLGPAAAFAALAWQIPEQPWVAQTLLMAAVGLQSFGAAGYEAGIQEKAGERWAGLMYSITSLPAVMVGTAGVYITGQVLDFTHQDWSYVYGLNAAINVLGTLAFVSMYNSKREFD